MFMHGALGKGYDSLYPELTFGGPSPIGVQRANLDPPVRRIIEEFGYQEVGQLRAVLNEVGGVGVKRPLLNLSKEAFAEFFDKAFSPSKLNPPFDPYANTINFLLAANMFPYAGLVGLVGAAPALLLPRSRKLATQLLSGESGQNGVIRTLLYERADEIVVPYNITVAEFTNRTSELANRLANCGIKDEGVMVPLSLGAEKRTESNVLAYDTNSVPYSRTAQEVLSILYGTGDEGVPGAFFPKGANGLIAQTFIRIGRIL